MLNILLVEDDRDLANTLIEYLTLDGIDCDYACDGVMGLKLAKSQPYEVLVLDINLPRMNGLDLCKTLRQIGHDTPILMLTARDQIDDKLTGFAVGADDYLVKPFEMLELVARIQVLSKRKSKLTNVLTCVDLEMDLSTKTLKRQGQLIELSPTAWTLLEILMKASPAPVSRHDLEYAVWGESIPNSNSLKVHIHNLRKAIDGPFNEALLHTVARHGFAIKPAEKDS